MTENKDTQSRRPLETFLKEKKMYNKALANELALPIAFLDSVFDGNINVSYDLYSEAYHGAVNKIITYAGLRLKGDPSKDALLSVLIEKEPHNLKSISPDAKPSDLIKKMFKI